MNNDIQTIMKEVFSGSDQPIQAQMTGFYLKTEHKSTGWPANCCLCNNG